MRVLLQIVGLALGMLSSAAYAADCICTDVTAQPLTRFGAENMRPQFEPENANLKGFSSFRGVSLDMRESEAKHALERLGFNLVNLQTTKTAKEICRGVFSVGTLRFDKNYRVNKIELNPAYFGVGRTDLREFVESIFKRFAVRQAPISDDICFGEVTCFRGNSLAEQFLILRITEDVQLHVSSKRGQQFLGSNQ